MGFSVYPEVMINPLKKRKNRTIADAPILLQRFQGPQSN